MADGIDNGEQINTEPEVSSSENTDVSEQETDQQTGDQESTDEQGEASESDGSDEGGESEVPDKYELKKPEDSLLDDEAIASIEKAAKEFGFTNEQAQKYLEQQNEAVSRYQQQAVENWQKQQTEWVNTVKSDKELGGDKFDDSVKLARTALGKFADKQFVDALNESGYGNHPELVRTFARIGKLLGEDGPLGSETSQGGHKSLAEKFYPSMNKG